MPTIAEFRASNPTWEGRSDQEMVDYLANKLGVSNDYAANYLGVPKNTAGTMTDVGVDLARGVNSVGRIGTGLANLVTDGESGKLIKNTFGGDLGDVDKYLSTKYSDKRNASDAEVENAHGFIDKSIAYATHPRSAGGDLIQGLPSMLLPIGAAGKVASMVESRLAVAAAERGLTAEATKEFIAKGVKESLANQLATPAAWGVTAGAQTADQQIHDNPNDTGAMYGAAAGAAGANAVGMGLSHYLPGGGAAQAFATGEKGLVGGVAQRIGSAVGNQAATMAGINAGTTITGNEANGRDWDHGLGDSMASGMVAGGGFGLAHGVMHGAPGEKSNGLKVNGDGEVHLPDGSALPPSDAMAAYQKQNEAAAAQIQAQQDAAKQQDDHRSAVFDNYSGKERTRVDPTSGEPVPDGYSFGGKEYYTKDDLNKALDAQLKKEDSNSLGQNLGTTALIHALKTNGIEDITPSNVMKAGDLIPDATKILVGAVDEHAVLHRVTGRIDAETGMVDAYNTQLKLANKLLEAAKTEAADGNDATLASKQKRVDTVEQKIAETQKRLGFYNDWAQSLKDQTGARHGTNDLNESTNRSTEVPSKTSDNSVAVSDNAKASADVSTAKDQRPEQPVVAQQPHQESQVVPLTPETQPAAVAAPVVTVKPRRTFEKPVVEGAPIATAPVEAVPTTTQPPSIKDPASFGRKVLTEKATPALSELAQKAQELQQSGKVTTAQDLQQQLGVDNQGMSHLQDELTRHYAAIEKTKVSTVEGQLAASWKATGMRDTIAKNMLRDAAWYRDHKGIAGLTQDHLASLTKKADGSQLTQKTVAKGIAEIEAKLEAHKVSSADIATLLGREERSPNAHMNDEGFTSGVHDELHTDKSALAAHADKMISGEGEHALVNPENIKVRQEHTEDHNNYADDHVGNDELHSNQVAEHLDGVQVVKSANDGKLTNDTRAASDVWAKAAEELLLLTRALDRNTPKGYSVGGVGRAEYIDEPGVRARMDKQLKIMKYAAEEMAVTQNYTAISANLDHIGKAEDYARTRAAEKNKEFIEKYAGKFYSKDPNVRHGAIDALAEHNAMQPRSEGQTTKNHEAVRVAQNDIGAALNDMGITKNNPGLSRIAAVLTEPMTLDSNGSLFNHPLTKGGPANYTVLVASHLAESGDSARISEVVSHEYGHAIDMAPEGGIYSSQPELGFHQMTNGELVGMHAVATEILTHYKDGGTFAEYLRYPFAETENFNGKSASRAWFTSKEVFAQIWQLYQNEHTRPVLVGELPLTAKYLSEVHQHAKDTSATVHSPTTADPKQLASDFRTRARTTEDGAARSGDREQLGADTELNDARRDQADDGGSKGTEASDTSSSGSKDAGGELGQRLLTKSVAEAGTPPTPAERSVRSEAIIKKLPVGLQRPVRGITADIAHFATRGLQASAFLHDLADWGAKHGMTAMTDISRLFSEKGAYKGALDKKLGAVAEMYDKLKPADQEAVGKYLMAAQFDHSNQWGYTPVWKSEAKLNSRAVTEHNKLSLEAHNVVDAVLKHTSEQRAALQETYNSHVNDLHDDMAQGARDSNAHEEIPAIEEARTKALSKVKLPDSDAAYAPLKRFGDHVVTVRSEQLRKLLEDPAANKSDIGKMLSDPEHYQVEHHASAGEAANRVAELQETLGDKFHIEASEKEKVMQLGTQAYEVLQNMAEGAAKSADPEFAHVLNNAMTYSIIKSMSETTSRGSALHRKLIAGMKSDEMIRAFISNGYSDNAMLTAAVHNKEIAAKMKELREQVKGGKTAEDRGIRQNFYNEIMQRRINAAKMHDPAPWVSHAMRFTSVWKLITSPAYYLQYLSQPLTMAAPVLQGNHGYAKGMMALGRGIRESFDTMKAISGGKTLSGKDGARLTDMLNDLKKTGTINIGHSQQFGQYHNRPEGKLSQAWIRATDKMAQLPHAVEMHNRVGTALGAYRLEFEKATAAGKSTEDAHKQATDYARKTINTAYGDYSSYAAPRVMTGGPMVKLMMQYRQFQAIHGAMLVRLMSNAFSGESADVRSAARHQLGYMSAHYAVLAGAMGIPGAHLLAGAIHQVFGDTDGPEDTLTFIKRHTGNGLMGKLITEGVPGAMGFGLGNRMGAGDIFSPFRGDTQLLPGTKKDYKDTALAVMGPFIGAMVPQVIDGVDRIGKGDYYRGLEQLMPKGIGDVMKAGRFATEGVSNRKGDTTLSSDALSGLDIAGQAFGASPLKVSDAQSVANTTHKFEQHFKDKANELSFNFIAARKDGSSVDSIVQQWKEMQDAQRREGFKPSTLSMLYQAQSRQRKRELSTMGGVEYTKNNRKFVEGLTTGEE